MAAADDDDLPRMLGGRYRLEATIGHGGMGVVYRGIDLTMQRPVAVKLIRSVDGNDIDDEIAGRFLREAKHTARLQHEHIIDVFDLGRDESGMYFVMELLTGESLSAKIRRDGKLPPDKAVHIGAQICDALEVAHRGGIIHRDLKPANIMLMSRAGDDAFVKVLDFGVAKSLGGDDMTQLTHTGMLVGTVDYMAPEQIMGKPVDGRTDVYSLGVMLYKMLCGKAPFRDSGVPALIHAHLNTMPKPLGEMTEGIPNELDHVILRCLMKKPERRYESMAELARALRHTMQPDDHGMVDLEYRGQQDSYDDNMATRLNTSEPVGLSRTGASAASRTGGSAASRSSAPIRGGKPYQDDDDDLPPPEDPTMSDDPTVQFDRQKPQRRLTAEELGLTSPSGLRAHEGHHPLPAPPKPRPLIPMSSNTPAFGPPVNFPEELSTQKRHVPNEVKRLEVQRSEGKICAMCSTRNPAHALACHACGVSLGTSEQEALRVRNRSAPPTAKEIPNIPSGLGLGAIGLPPLPAPPTPRGSRNVGTNWGDPPPPQAAPSAPPAPSSSRRDLGRTGPHQPPPMQAPQYPAPSMPPQGPPSWSPQQPPSIAPQYDPHSQYPGAPPGWPYQQQQSMPPPPATTWQRFLKWTGLK